jgi:hypothetical protein
MTYDDFIALNPKERGFGMFTEEANNKVKIMMEEIIYTIFVDDNLTREKFIPYIKKTMKKLYNSDSKNLAEMFDTEVEETIVLYLNSALKNAGHRFKITRWNIQQ